MDFNQLWTVEGGRAEVGRNEYVRHVGHIGAKLLVRFDGLFSYRQLLKNIVGLWLNGVGAAMIVQGEHC